MSCHSTSEWVTGRADSQPLMPSLQLDHLPSCPTPGPSHTRRVHPTPPYRCVGTTAWKSRFCPEFLKSAIFWTTLRLMGTHTDGMIHHLEEKLGKNPSACPGDVLGDACEEKFGVQNVVWKGIWIPNGHSPLGLCVFMDMDSGGRTHKAETPLDQVGVREILPRRPTQQLLYPHTISYQNSSLCIPPHLSFLSQCHLSAIWPFMWPEPAKTHSIASQKNSTSVNVLHWEVSSVSMLQGY